MLYWPARVFWLEYQTSQCKGKLPYWIFVCEGVDFVLNLKRTTSQTYYTFVFTLMLCNALRTLKTPFTITSCQTINTNKIALKTFQTSKISYYAFITAFIYTGLIIVMIKKKTNIFMRPESRLLVNKSHILCSPLKLNFWYLTFWQFNIQLEFFGIIHLL